MAKPLSKLRNPPTLVRAKTPNTQNNTPVQNTPQVTPHFVDANTPEKQIIANDFQLINMWGYHLCAHWNQPSLTLNQLATLGSQTTRFIQTRRKVADMSYGRSVSSQKQESIVYPLD